MQPRKRLASVALALALISPVWSQVPVGSYVVASRYSPDRSGPGGVFIVTPSGAEAVTTPVTGLPPDLTWSGLVGAGGANAVLVTSRSGRTLVVGEHGPPGAAIDLHVVTLTGSHATATKTIHIGRQIAGFGGGVMQCAALPGGKVLAATLGVPGASLWIVSMATGDVVPLTVTWPAGTLPTRLPSGFAGILALETDPEGTTAYVGLKEGCGCPAGCSRVYRVDLSTGVATMLTLVSGYVTGLDRGGDGWLVASVRCGAYGLISIHPESGFVEPVCGSGLGLGSLEAVAYDAASGHIAVGSAASTVYRVGPRTRAPCAAMFQTAGPPGGWSRVDDVAWHAGVPGQTQAATLGGGTGKTLSMDSASDGVLAVSFDPERDVLSRPRAVRFRLPDLPSLAGMTGQGTLLVLDPTSRGGIAAKAHALTVVR